MLTMSGHSSLVGKDPVSPAPIPRRLTVSLHIVHFTYCTWTSTISRAGNSFASEEDVFESQSDNDANATESQQ
jgi:hypothetical protein